MRKMPPAHGVGMLNRNNISNNVILTDQHSYHPIQRRIPQDIPNGE
jgi:hypothetical protein